MNFHFPLCDCTPVTLHPLCELLWVLCRVMTPELDKGCSSCMAETAYAAEHRPNLCPQETPFVKTIATAPNALTMNDFEPVSADFQLWERSERADIFGRSWYVWERAA